MTLVLVHAAQYDVCLYPAISSSFNLLLHPGSLSACLLNASRRIDDVKRVPSPYT